MIENVLASRYASAEMKQIWDPAGRIRLERELWIAVLEAQRRLGLDVADEVVEAYRAVVDQVDLRSIADRERVLRHDVKARLEEFNHLAGHESIHLGMTSRDLTENVEQLQVRRSLEVVLTRAVAAIIGMADLAARYAAVPITGRTHNVPAQVTTIGKRFASAGEELIYAVERVEAVLAGLPLRGIKGPVGTQADQAELLGDPVAADELDRLVAEYLGFEATLGSVGQVYPRSLDLDVVSVLNLLAAAPSSFTTTLRLMAGHELATEGFGQDQVGSSAMPHKMNARTSERIHGFKVILAGHLAMAAGVSGEQWNEGDVSCSVVRRVMLPDAFFAIDGLFQAFLTVLDEVGFYPAMIEHELMVNLPFLATTRLLVAAVRAGSGRETAHEVIRRHAVAAALDRRQHPDGAPGLLERLAEDPEFPLTIDAIREAIDSPLTFTGRAADQVEAFVASAADLARRHPAAATYRPEAIL
ncbi:MAG TPA: adenylosuccinate lyase [Acidimicrobiia bacterium]|nr:adenylosuccinate lyase [Acidimicrobiia bacterium]